MSSYFVVQAFQNGKRGSLVADPPMQVQSRDQARRVAERLSRSKVGVIAFSRDGDPESGEYDDAEILFAHGQLPAEAMDA